MHGVTTRAYCNNVTLCLVSKKVSAMMATKTKLESGMDISNTLRVSLFPVT